MPSLAQHARWTTSGVTAFERHTSCAQQRCDVGQIHEARALEEPKSDCDKHAEGHRLNQEGLPGPFPRRCPAYGSQQLLEYLSLFRFGH